MDWGVELLAAFEKVELHHEDEASKLTSEFLDKVSSCCSSTASKCERLHDAMDMQRSSQPDGLIPHVEKGDIDASI